MAVMYSSVKRAAATRNRPGERYSGGTNKPPDALVPLRHTEGLDRNRFDDAHRARSRNNSRQLESRRFKQVSELLLATLLASQKHQHFHVVHDCKIGGRSRV